MSEAGRCSRRRLADEILGTAYFRKNVAAAAAERARYLLFLRRESDQSAEADDPGTGTRHPMGAPAGSGVDTLSFDSLQEFFVMGGHGLYVWLAYGSGLLVVIANVVSVRIARKRYFRQARAFVRRDVAEGANRTAELRSE